MKTGRRECPFRIYASVSRNPVNPWKIRQVELEHNHAISSNTSTYAQFRKLSPEDFEFVCSLLKKGETPRTVLKVSIFFTAYS